MLAGDANLPKKKFVVVGDGYTGKTCMLFVYTKGEFPEVYVPTVFENQVTDIQIDGRSYLLALWDTAGQEDYSRLRPLSYPDSDVILICYSVDIPDSFDNIRTQWLPEVVHYCKGTPFLLVALKTDLRNDPAVMATLAKNGQSPIEAAQGRDLAAKIGAYRYVECSARKQEGVREVFEHGMRAALAAGSSNKHIRRRQSGSSTRPGKGKGKDCVII
ncbi:ras family-domain-containing protein [Chytriomyces cf. hyalinus JEL632]|nr:ras family-domain-containing protein [Chytriomyces cf. hyalinus JEL632]